MAIDTYVRVEEMLPPPRGVALRARIFGHTGVLIGAAVILAVLAAALAAPLIAPTEVPHTRSGRTPASSNARTMPTSAAPSTPPPPSTNASHPIQ